MSDNKTLNFLVAALVAGCLALNVAHYVMEQNFLIEVKGLVDWHKQRVESADADEKLVKHLVRVAGVSKEAAEAAVVLSDAAFKERLRVDPKVFRAMAIATIYTDNGKLKNETNELEEVKTNEND